MANISDSAGIFVGGNLELFNQMQTVVARDGDQAGAQAEMREAMKRVISVTTVSTSGSGQNQGRRKG
jgi:hypothetical protein